MKRLLLIVMLLLVAVIPAAAQNASTLSFNGISFTFNPELGENVVITSVAGDATDLQQPGGPVPPHTQFTLFSGAQAPDLFGGTTQIHVYNTAALSGYADALAEVERLTALLADRTDLSEAVSSDPLPYLPVFAASQVVAARAEYVDFDGLSGIRYVTAYRQDASPFTATNFLYTFQGLTTDGAVYVAVTIPLTVTSDAFPAEIPADFDFDAFTADIETYFAQSVETLNTLDRGAFAPSLDAADALFASFSIALTPGAVPPTVTEPTAEPTQAAGDPTLGGLAGTWQLVSFGPADAQVTPLENTAITLSFTPEGAGGSDSCNTYGGSFEYALDTLTFGPLISTMMACDQAIMDQAIAYTGFLQGVTNFAVSGDTLTLTGAGGTATFTRSA